MSTYESNETPSPERDLVQQHVNQLAEHFDSVQIFVTAYDGSHDRTRTVNLGAGNWFSRYGQVREWVIYEDEKIKLYAREQNESSRE